MTKDMRAHINKDPNGRTAACLACPKMKCREYSGDIELVENFWDVTMELQKKSNKIAGPAKSVIPGLGGGELPGKDELLERGREVRLHFSLPFYVFYGRRISVAVVVGFDKRKYFRHTTNPHSTVGGNVLFSIHLVIRMWQWLSNILQSSFSVAISLLLLCGRTLNSCGPHPPLLLLLLG